MAKPTLKPIWATGGGAAIVEPSGPKKALGWVVEKPPHEFFNWLLNLIYQWIEWFDLGHQSVLSVTAAGTTAIPLGSKKVFVDATLGNVTLTLPDVSTLAANESMRVEVVKIDASVNTVTVQSVVGGKLISGEANQVIDQQYTTLNMDSFLTNWFLF